ncbi:THO complex subunit 1 transcription elongation factor-domain-containing protein [Zychaea mexicana]|uniref:THO complex subunit 1 transcription elongation factor-domain-containing protein n=1 Tax=Zychaea mexicana TaxID=64656 RepID=UPI0022FE5A52|nr:THO complex subunit 1 transcription elongation factor-domain-containing protein [Zychaea mexicana]KAI9499738.1 THO complex subunit 1 transcription elongation factor-domain-containing protein [Zychaea mexicana]
MPITQQFDIYHERVRDAILHCIDASRSSSITTNTATKVSSDINLADLENLVRSNIGPLASNENVLNINLMDERPDWRKSAAELAFRKILLDLVQREPETAPDHFTHLFNVLDVVLATVELGYLEPVVPLTLIEELLDVHTIDGCEKLFDYIEKRKARLTVNMIPGRGKGLVLLRMCNEMLRRLSKEKNTVFCGRILMFLANSFPLGERSGVNLRGDFNTEPVQFDKDEDVDNDPSLTEEQKTFYKLFWSTRKYFSNPPTIFQSNGFDELRKGGDAILDRFKQISSNEQAVSGDSSGGVAPSDRAGSKRKRSEDMDIDDTEDKNTRVQQMLDDINRQYQFPRLLSSRKLLELEIEDTRFRRNVIVQFLILFQYLHGFTQAEKEDTQKLLNSRGATKQSLVQPNFTLEGKELQWVQETEKSMLDLLKQTKPHGELYTDIVETVLRHERNWIIWKASGCPAFEKPPITRPDDIEQTRQVKRNRLRDAYLRRYRYLYGSPEITKMYSQEPSPLTGIMQSRPALPEPTEVIDAALAKVEQQEHDLSVIERFDIANGALFQATRLLFRSHAVLIPKVYNIKKEVYKALKEAKKEGDANGETTTTTTTAERPSAAAAAAAIKTSVSVDQKDERHLEAEITVLRKTRGLIVNATLAAAAAPPAAGTPTTPSITVTTTTPATNGAATPTTG